MQDGKVFLGIRLFFADHRPTEREVTLFRDSSIDLFPVRVVADILLSLLDSIKGTICRRLIRLYMIVLSGPFKYVWRYLIIFQCCLSSRFTCICRVTLGFLQIIWVLLRNTINWSTLHSLFPGEDYLIFQEITFVCSRWSSYGHVVAWWTFRHLPRQKESNLGKLALCNGRNGLKTRITRLQIYSISTDVFDDDRPSTLCCSTIPHYKGSQSNSSSQHVPGERGNIQNCPGC